MKDTLKQHTMLIQHGAARCGRAESAWIDRRLATNPLDPELLCPSP
jgi:hypothetical protein